MGVATIQITAVTTLGQQNRTIGSLTSSQPIVLLKRLRTTPPCRDKTQIDTKPQEPIVVETYSAISVGNVCTTGDKQPHLGDSSISIKSGPDDADFGSDEDECNTNSQVVDTLIDTLQSEYGDQEPQTNEQHILNITITDPRTLDTESSGQSVELAKESSTKGKANTKRRPYTKRKYCKKGTAKGDATGNISSNTGTTRINTTNINVQKTYAMSLRQRRLSQGRIRAVTAKKLRALQEVLTSNISRPGSSIRMSPAPVSEFSCDNRPLTCYAQKNKTNKSAPNKRSQPSDPYDPDMIFAAPSYPKRIPRVPPDRIPKRVQSHLPEPVAGPSGLQNTLLVPVAGPSGLQRVTTEPVAGPSGLGVISAVVSGPSGLQRITMAPVPGPSEAAPVAGPSHLQMATTEPVPGPSGLQREIVAPVPGPSGLQMVTTEPVPGPSGLQRVTAAPVPGPRESKFFKYRNAQKMARLQGKTSNMDHENNPGVAHSSTGELPRANIEAIQPQANVEVPRASVVTTQATAQSRFVERYMLSNVYEKGESVMCDANSDDDIDGKDNRERERGSIEELNETRLLSTQPRVAGGALHEGPVYRPTKEEFQNPMEYFIKILDQACEFGICKVIPPPGWKPKSQSCDGLRFDIQRLYVSRILNRWGSSMRELASMKFCASRTNGFPCSTPTIAGMEVNLPKLYHSVQRHGGLHNVLSKKYWGRVARDMNLCMPVKYLSRLQYLYAKYLLPYDSLSPTEGRLIFGIIEKAWIAKSEKMLDHAIDPLKAQRRLMGLCYDEELEEHSSEMNAIKEAENCITRGPIMNYAKFKEVAESTYSLVYGYGVTPENNAMSLDQKEELFWRYVLQGKEHICVASAAIDTGSDNRTFLGPVSGLTAPTLNLGMAFSTKCFYYDPHAVSWMDVLHKGHPRIWYAIPPEQSENFRKAVSVLCPAFCQRKSLWLSPNTTMIPPQLLREHNVSVTRIVQEEHEIVLSFPYGFTSFINTGYSESESFYFASLSWLHSAYEVFKEARENCEPTMFSLEELLFRIGKASRVDRATLTAAQPIFDKILRNELTNRLILQERGMKIVHQPDVPQPQSTGRRRRRNRTVIQENCEYCRAPLFFSKVVGLVDDSYLCLEHALKMLTCKKMKITEDMKIITKNISQEKDNIHSFMGPASGLTAPTLNLGILNEMLLLGPPRCMQSQPSRVRTTGRQTFVQEDCEYCRAPSKVSPVFIVGLCTQYLTGGVAITNYAITDYS
ncbi:hypothetical protein SFRURICE_006258 [Spodoptera frugiperda]|nr:hypothetical protein SFRURICE_006258 [Spodoptera frugiperda]